MPNQCEKKVEVVTCEDHRCMLKIQMADVQKLFMSMDRTCDAGHKVAASMEGPSISRTQARRPNSCGQSEAWSCGKPVCFHSVGEVDLHSAEMVLVRPREIWVEMDGVGVPGLTLEGGGSQQRGPEEPEDLHSSWSSRGGWCGRTSCGSPYIFDELRGAMQGARPDARKQHSGTGGVHGFWDEISTETCTKCRRSEARGHRIKGQEKEQVFPGETGEARKMKKWRASVGRRRARTRMV